MDLVITEDDDESLVDLFSFGVLWTERSLAKTHSSVMCDVLGRKKGKAYWVPPDPPNPHTDPPALYKLCMYCVTFKF